MMTVALQYSLKSERLIPLVPFFSLKIALAIQGFFCSHPKGYKNCEIICSRSVKNTIGFLIGIASTLKIAWGGIHIFTILILSIHEHGIFLHLFVSSLISHSPWDQRKEKQSNSDERSNQIHCYKSKGNCKRWRKGRTIVSREERTRVYC